MPTPGVAVAAGGGTAVYRLQIPPVPALAALSLHLQWLIVEIGPSGRIDLTGNLVDPVLH